MPKTPENRFPDEIWDEDKARIADNQAIADSLPARSTTPARRRRETQQALLLEGGSGLIPDAPLRGELDSESALPPGPYGVGMTRWESGDGLWHEGMPFTVTCGTGQAIAGHVPSRVIAEAIAEALNHFFPL